jgi:hypothetical protein
MTIGGVLVPSLISRPLISITDLTTVVEGSLRVSSFLYTVLSQFLALKIHACHKMINVHTITPEKAGWAYNHQGPSIMEGTFDMLKRGSTPLPAPACRFDTQLDANSMLGEEGTSPCPLN